MSDELSKQASKHKFLPQIEKESRFNRFYQKINQFFKRETPIDHRLTGRIRELHSEANEVLEELIHIREILKVKLAPSLYATVAGILDVSIKEMTRLKQDSEKQIDATHSVKIYQRHVEWIEKIKPWTELTKEDPSPEKIEYILSRHIAREFHSCIDRDIKLIEDYLNHALVNLNTIEDQNIVGSLQPHLQKQFSYLERLKHFSTELSLEKMLSWRVEADHAREKCFSDALHIIDSYIQQLIPKTQPKVDNELSLHLLTEIVMLEESIHTLKKDLAEYLEKDEKFKKNCKATLEKLERDAHQLNSNLHLSHEHCGRVQEAIETLSSFREIVI